VQAVGYGMTKPQRWLVIDSAKFARWLVRHLWGNALHVGSKFCMYEFTELNFLSGH